MNIKHSFSSKQAFKKEKDSQKNYRQGGRRPRVSSKKRENGL